MGVEICLNRRKNYNITGNDKPIFDLDLEGLMESSDNEETDSAIESIQGSPIHFVQSENEGKMEKSPVKDVYKPLVEDISSDSM